MTKDLEKSMWQHVPRDIRREYHHDGLDQEEMHADPIQEFERWFNEALNNNLDQVNAMSLATATKDGKPSVRTVLLKHYGQDGFIFYTNYNSRKGKELLENPHAALLLYWAPLDRQVRIEGFVEKADAKNFR